MRVKIFSIIQFMVNKFFYKIRFILGFIGLILLSFFFIHNNQDIAINLYPTGIKFDVSLFIIFLFFFFLGYIFGYFTNYFSLIKFKVLNFFKGKKINKIESRIELEKAKIDIN